MAITKEELGLTEEQYNALMYQVDDPVWSVVAHRYNLDFKYRETSLERFENHNWDAIAIPNFNCVAVLFGTTVRFYHEVDGSSKPANITISALSNTVYSPSLYYDESENKLYVFSSTGTNLVRYVYTLSLGGNTAGTTYTYSTLGLGGNEIITQIAAVSVTDVHIVVKQTVRRTYNLRLVNTTTVKTSRIHYQYPIQSFSVVRFNGSDIIVVATQTPGTISTKAVGDDVVRYIEHSGGVISWTYKDGIWSDHYVIDVVDNLTTSRIRKSVRMSITHDRVTVTAFAAVGAEPFSTGSYRMYSTKDGQFWSLGRMMPVDQPTTNEGLKLVCVGDVVFACDYGGLYVSDSTLEIGYSPASMQVDITEDILDYSLSEDTMTGASIVLDNQDDQYLDNPILSINNTVALVHKAGYWVGGVKRLFQIAVTEIDSIEFSTQGHEKQCKIVSRGRLSWMTDKFSSENSEYWEGQLIGADNFTDETDSQYGGLRHTSVQTGTWKTEGNLIEIATKNKEGISFNSFSSYVWNGAYTIQFKLSQLANNEYAGIIFRALDKDNFWSMVYNQSTDKIVLYQRKNGVSTAINSPSTSLSWSGSVSVYRYMRVEFYYASINLYYSNDGITWSLLVNYIASGLQGTGISGTALLDRGYVGQIGKGYHYEPEWLLPEFILPDLTFVPFNMDFVFDLPQPLTSDPTPDETELLGYGAFASAHVRPGYVTARNWSVMYDFSDSRIGFSDVEYDGQEAYDKWTIIPVTPGLPDYQYLETNGAGISSNGPYDQARWIIIDLNLGEEQNITEIRFGYKVSDRFISTTAFIQGGIGTYNYAEAGYDVAVFETDFNVTVLRATLRGFYDLSGPIFGGSGGIRYIQIWGYGNFSP